MDNSWVIKSFKHDGHLHRMWLENWLVPKQHIHPKHADEDMLVLVNSHTQIIEADGTEWVSKVPSVSFFIPKQWYNIVALIEDAGVRYYCNIASPPYQSGGSTLTYIDYDLDVILFANKTYQIVDIDEYEEHSTLYHYSVEVRDKVTNGLNQLLQRLDSGSPPFDDAAVRRYYGLWRNRNRGVQDESMADK